MVRINALAGIALLVSGIAHAAGAETGTPVDWLNRMAEAMRSENYIGTFVYYYGDRLEALRIYHRYDDGNERERLVSLNGTAREILRDGGKVTCIFPDSREVVVNRRQTRNPLSDVVPAEAGRLKEGYELRLNGDGRVAGREAQRLALQPRGKYRYGYELWIDRESDLLLRSDLLDEQGRLIERVMFTDISPGEAIKDDWLAPSISGEDFTWYRYDGEAGPPGRNSDSHWAVGDLPAGFRLAMNERRRLPGSKGLVEHRLYSDGLATVSVYIEKRSAGIHTLAGHSSMGAMNAYGRRVGDYQLVVVGEVPARTVARFADAFAYDAE